MLRRSAPAGRAAGAGRRGGGRRLGGRSCRAQAGRLVQARHCLVLHACPTQRLGLIRVQSAQQLQGTCMAWHAHLLVHARRGRIKPRIPHSAPGSVWLACRRCLVAPVCRSPHKSCLSMYPSTDANGNPGSPARARFEMAGGQLGGKCAGLGRSASGRPGAPSSTRVRPRVRSEAKQQPWGERSCRPCTSWRAVRTGAAPAGQRVFIGRRMGVRGCRAGALHAPSTRAGAATRVVGPHRPQRGAISTPCGAGKAARRGGCSRAASCRMDPWQGRWGSGALPAGLGSRAGVRTGSAMGRAAWGRAAAGRRPATAHPRTQVVRPGEWAARWIALLQPHSAYTTRPARGAGGPGPFFCGVAGTLKGAQLH